MDNIKMDQFECLTQDEESNIDGEYIPPRLPVPFTPAIIGYLMLTGGK